VKIGELSRRTGVSPRMLRYYQEQGLLHPTRDPSGYRRYPETAVALVTQIRGLLETGMTSEIIAAILPCLDDPEDVRATAHCLPPATLALVTAQLGRLQQRIDCLTRSRDAITAYLATARGGPGSAEAGT
jgi:DNA-binding transcriptional MerR regulator